jgi:hypothetical protein
MQFDELLISSQSTKQVTKRATYTIYIIIVHGALAISPYSRNGMRLNAMASLIFICIDLQTSQEPGKLSSHTQIVLLMTSYFSMTFVALAFATRHRCSSQYCFLHRTPTPPLLLLLLPVQKPPRTIVFDFKTFNISFQSRQ